MSNTTSNTPGDCCSRVRSSCSAWMTEPQHQALVKIQPSKVTELAKSILQKSKDGSRPSIEWDDEEWHYRPSPKLSTEVARERLALYILAMDAINFCFWPSHTASYNSATNFEYEHLSKGMARMAQKDEEKQAQLGNTLNPDYIFSPARLASLTQQEMEDLWITHLTNLSEELSVPPITPLDNIETRCKLWNEIGTVLLKEPWNGSVIKFMQKPNSRELLVAPELVDRVIECFPGFRDNTAWGSNGNNNTSSIPKDATLHLYKRAQIFVGDLNASLKLQLKDTSHITTFADYRVPQLLRHAEVLQYEPDLARTVDEGKEIPKESLEEKTIRAATVVAVEELVKELKILQRKESTSTEEYTAMTLDWYLWQEGERMHLEGSLKPHHKTRTTFY